MECGWEDPLRSCPTGASEHDRQWPSSGEEKVRDDSQRFGIFEGPSNVAPRTGDDRRCGAEAVLGRDTRDF